MQCYVFRYNVIALSGILIGLTLLGNKYSFAPSLIFWQPSSWAKGNVNRKRQNQKNVMPFLGIKISSALTHTHTFTATILARYFTSNFDYFCRTYIHKRFSFFRANSKRRQKKCLAFAQNNVDAKHGSAIFASDEQECVRKTTKSYHFRGALQEELGWIIL